MQPKVATRVLDAATLKSRAEFYAKKEEKKEVRGEIKEFLCFRMGREKYLAEIQSVHEVLPVSRISRLPLQKEGVVGMMNVRGNAVLILNLSSFLHAGASSIEPSSKILLIKSGSDLTGLVADQIYGEARWDTGEMQLPVASLKGVSLEFIKGFFKQNGEPLIWLDVEKILKRISNQMAGNRS